MNEIRVKWFEVSKEEAEKFYASKDDCIFKIAQLMKNEIKYIVAIIDNNSVAKAVRERDVK